MNRRSTRRLARVMTLLATLGTPAPTLAANAEVLWVYETTGGYLDSSPAVADLDGDGSPDICMTSLAGPVFALDALGREIWKIDLKERITIAPTAADVSGDRAPEVLVVTQTGRLYCLEGRSGDVIWVYDIPSRARLDSVASYTLEFTPDEPIKHGGTTIVAADIDADGAVELVTNTVRGAVLCLNAAGDLLWSYDAGENLPAAPAVGDLDGDGVAEVVIGSLEHPATCLSAEGTLRWQYDADADLPNIGRNKDIASPVIADLDGDGRGEVVTVDENTMLALDADGAVLWTTVVSRKRVDASLTIADADRDGSPEIYVVDLTGDVVRVNADGARVWTTNIGQRCRRGFSVADVDGDGAVEIVVGAYTGKIHVFAPDGVIEEELEIGSGTNATSTLADLLGDGGVCVVTPEITGNLAVYRWAPGTTVSEILVPGYRGGNSRTASSFTTPVEREPLFEALSTGSIYDRRPVFTVELKNPARDALTVRLTVADDNGIAGETTRTIRGNSRGARLSYDGDRLVGNAIYTCTASRDDSVLESHTFTRVIRPFAAALDALREQAARIETLMSEVSDVSGVAERHAYLQGALPALASRTGELGHLSAMQLRELWSNLAALSEDLARLEMLVSAARDAGTALVVSQANPWAPFGGVDELSEGRMGGESLSVEAFGGEVESAALNVWNFSGTAKTLRVTMSGLALGDTVVSDAVTVREVVAVPTQRAKMSADAVPELRGSRTIVVPAWSARQVWLEVHTEALRAGTWTGELRLRNMSVVTEEAVAPVTITVWAVAQSREHVFNLCGWAKTRGEGVLEDMLSHGMNVFTDARPVPFQYDADGSIVSADYSALDAYMASHAPEGTALFHSLVRLTGPAERFSEVWNRAYNAAVKQFVAHVEEIGFDYSDYAYYPVDEPGIGDGRRVAAFVQWSAITRQADPDIRIYTNPIDLPYEWLEELNPYVDIYAPFHSGAWHNDPQEARHVELMHGDGHELWTYTCSDNAKHLSPLGYSRAQPWMSFNDGHTGGGIYTYSRYNDTDWHVAGLEYNLVYSGDDGPIPSKRWEAVRDGVEDYSMLMALRAAAAAPGARPDLVRRARALLAGDVVTVGNFCGLDDDGTVPGKEGMSAARRLADRRYATITSVRREMHDLLEAFAE